MAASEAEELDKYRAPALDKGLDILELLAATEDGYPLAKRLIGQVIEGPLVRAPGIEGGVLLSVRGGDYELTVGQDLSIGYAAHDPHIVELFLTESFTFRVLEAVAAVRLTRS